MTVSWTDFENELLKEFDAILSHFDSIKTVMNEDTRKDFLGLLQYTLITRKSFRSIASKYGIEFTQNNVDNGVVNSQNDGIVNSQNNGIVSYSNDAAIIAEELVTKDLESFAPEYSHFRLILQNHSVVPESVLIQLCLKYWKHQYPSVKMSFILPICALLSNLSEHLELKQLLSRRLLKGKLDPFDESIKLCQTLQISPDSTDFCDHQLSALKDLLHNHQQLQIDQVAALQQSGCHCD